MEKELRQRITELIRNSINAIKNNNPSQLNQLSDGVIHSATILQSKYTVEIMTLIYSLAKIYERDRYKSFKGWNKFNKYIELRLQDLVDDLTNNNEKSFLKNLASIFTTINKLDKRLRHYVNQVIENAKITKGSRIHEHGISLGQTASILNVPQHELMQYTGTTGISDADLSISGNLKKRLNLARKLFK